MKKTEKKQFKELTEEELKEVTGGLVKDMPIALVPDESEFTCPDGRKVSSITQCVADEGKRTFANVVELIR